MKNRKRISVAAIVFLICAFISVACAEEAVTVHVPSVYQTAWSLLPALIAIGLALITKEVYSSLFIGIIAGGLMYSNFNFEMALNHVFNDGLVGVLSDSYNVGILVFLVVLGAMVYLMNKAGGSAAFGRWASTRIKSRIGAQLATVALGVMIFVDDYFNCLTVGSVMRPVADKQKISRAKLAYIIDATAAPICIIAPISSWAAAVASYVEEGNGFAVFLQAIPYNFYAILTLVMLVVLAVLKIDYGPIARQERLAQEGDDAFAEVQNKSRILNEETNPKGKVIDLVLPVVFLIAACMIGMIYTGGFFSGVGFVEAFSACDASVGLMLGSSVTLIFTLVYYMLRRVMSFKELMESLPEGFKAMVPAILILTFAWTLKVMTDSLGAREFVAALVKNSAGGLSAFLPAIVFVIGCFLAFATGTSWGTFGILIPITLDVFPLTDPLGIICVSACMAGAVCGDHCSPISDTTIMASAGAQCDHVTHVSTQLPYAMTVAAVSFVSYIIAGFINNWLIVLPVAIVLMIMTLVTIKTVTGRKV